MEKTAEIAVFMEDMSRSPTGRRRRRPSKRRRGASDEGGNDLISNLPEDLKTCILDLMPIRDAARTSILSKTWKNLWRSRDSVYLGREFCDQLLSKQQAMQIYYTSLIEEAVDKILLSHQGPIVNFSLFIPIYDLLPRCGSWMSLLSAKGVEHLELLNFTDYLLKSMPSHCFYFPKLLSLRLRNCSLHPPPEYRHFCRLTSVYLMRVRFNADMSFGPQLNQLSLVQCAGIHHLRLQFTHHNKNLNKLKLSRSYKLEFLYPRFHDKGKVSSMKECIDINSFLSSTPNMATLILNGLCLSLMDPTQTILTRPMENMKTLVLHDVDFYDMHHMSNVLSLIKSSPNLKYLQISVAHRVDNPVNLEVERYLRTWKKKFVLNQLHTVEIGETVRSRLGLLLITLFYGSAPSLKRLYWGPFTVDGIHAEEFDKNDWRVVQVLL